MYLLETIRNHRKLLNPSVFQKMDGFMMASSDKVIQVGDSRVRDIRILNKELAFPFASERILYRYQKLVEYVTNLLFDDSEGDGESCREALNQIERFRLIVKNQYLDFLSRSELEMMSKQLQLLQKEAERKYYEIQNQLHRTVEETRHSSR